MPARHAIIPIFVPHEGCPHDCIFCSQRKISGQMDRMTAEQVPQIIESHLETIPSDSRIEVAFYGGSFTAIDKAYQEGFLKAAAPYLSDGAVSEIRLSTRPDYIDSEILQMLNQYGVKTIELGVQSMDDDVLKASFRGHDSAIVYRSAAMIREWGFRLGIQTMTGLPLDSRDKCLTTARKVISMSPEIVRIYPVLVIKGTGLERLLREGKYIPQTLDEAIMLCAELLDLYEENGITVIRVGLQANDSIGEGPQSEVVAGPVHPAFRQLVESKRMLGRIERELCRLNPACRNELQIFTGSGNLSNAIGQKRSNLEYLKEKYGYRLVRVMPDNVLGNKIILKCN